MSKSLESRERKPWRTTLTVAAASIALALGADALSNQPPVGSAPIFERVPTPGQLQVHPISTPGPREPRFLPPVERPPEPPRK